jgi:hypothetical protein
VASGREAVEARHRCRGSPGRDPADARARWLRHRPVSPTTASPSSRSSEVEAADRLVLGDHDIALRRWSRTPEALRLARRQPGGDGRAGGPVPARAPARWYGSSRVTGERIGVTAGALTSASESPPP